MSTRTEQERAVDEAVRRSKLATLGPSGTGTGAPTTADYLVRTADATLTAERVVTDTTSVVWDWSVAGQAKATVAPVLLSSGTGSPESVVTAPVGAVYEQTDAAAGIHPVWIKRSGVGNTGWRRGAGQTGADGAATGATSVVIGDSATAAVLDAVAIGINASAGQTQGIAIGSAAYSGVGLGGSVAIGFGAQAAGDYSVAVGSNAQIASTTDSCVAIGYGIVPSVSNQVLIGRNVSRITFGGQFTAAVSFAGVRNVGLDRPAAAFTFTGYNGSGAGASNTWAFQTGTTTGTSSVEHVSTTRLLITESGIQVTGSITQNGQRVGVDTIVNRIATDADYTITATDVAGGWVTVLMTTVTGRSVFLPAIASTADGTRVTVHNDNNAGTTTLDGNAAETINGAATLACAGAYRSRTVLKAGGEWKVVASYL